MVRPQSEIHINGHNPLIIVVMCQVRMDHTTTARGMKLPTTVFGRFSFACVCLPLLAISALACVALHTTVPQPQTAIGWVFHFVVEALFVGLFAFSASGFLWCITQSAWSEHLLVKGTLRLLIPLMLFCLISLPFVLWALCNA